MFSMEDNISAGAIIRGCRGLYDFSSYRKGKVVGWVNSGGMTHISYFTKDLLFFCAKY